MLPFTLTSSKQSAFTFIFSHQNIRQMTLRCRACQVPAFSSSFLTLLLSIHPNNNWQFMQNILLIKRVLCTKYLVLEGGCNFSRGKST